MLTGITWQTVALAAVLVAGLVAIVVLNPTAGTALLSLIVGAAGVGAAQGQPMLRRPPSTGKDGPS